MYVIFIFAENPQDLLNTQGKFCSCNLHFLCLVQFEKWKDHTKVGCNKPFFKHIWLTSVIEELSKQKTQTQSDTTLRGKQSGPHINDTQASDGDAAAWPRGDLHVHVCVRRHARTHKRRATVRNASGAFRVARRLADLRRASGISKHVNTLILIFPSAAPEVGWAGAWVASSVVTSSHTHDTSWAPHSPQPDATFK